MAKKNVRSEKSESPTSQPAVERRRTVRATTRKAAASSDVPVAEPDGSPAVVRATANDMRTDGNGHTTPAPTYEQIAEAAYQRYLQRGGWHGNDFEDWLDAERESLARSVGHSRLPTPISQRACQLIFLEVGSWMLRVDQGLLFAAGHVLCPAPSGKARSLSASSTFPLSFTP